MKSFEKLPDEKRRLIEEVGMNAFIEGGYALANTVDIARKCGIAKGSLFHYFGSKKGLYLYLVRTSMDRIMEETRKGLSGIQAHSYLERVRQSVAVKMALPLRCPRETALMTRAFSERGHEAADELLSMSMSYAGQLREMTGQFLGEPESGLIRDDIDIMDAQAYIQMVFDATTARLMQQYARNQQVLLDNPQIVSTELEKVIDFILHGIGK